MSHNRCIIFIFFLSKWARDLFIYTDLMPLKYGIDRSCTSDGNFQMMGFSFINEKNKTPTFQLKRETDKAGKGCLYINYIYRILRLVPWIIASIIVGILFCTMKHQNVRNFACSTCFTLINTRSVMMENKNTIIPTLCFYYILQRCEFHALCIFQRTYQYKWRAVKE